MSQGGRPKKAVPPLYELCIANCGSGTRDDDKLLETFLTTLKERTKSTCSVDFTCDKKRNMGSKGCFVVNLRPSNDEDTKHYLNENVYKETEDGQGPFNFQDFVRMFSGEIFIKNRRVWILKYDDRLPPYQYWSEFENNFQDGELDLLTCDRFGHLADRDAGERLFFGIGIWARDCDYVVEKLSFDGTKIDDINAVILQTPACYFLPTLREISIPGYAGRQAVQDQQRPRPAQGIKITIPGKKGQQQGSQGNGQQQKKGKRK